VGSKWGQLAKLVEARYGCQQPQLRTSREIVCVAHRNWIQRKGRGRGGYNHTFCLHVWVVQYFTHHFHSCYFFSQLDFLILNLKTSILFHYIRECVSYILPQRLCHPLVLQLGQSSSLPCPSTQPSEP